MLTHWGWVTHICVGNLTIIGSDNGLSPGRRQAIIWTSVGILLIGPLGTNFSEIPFCLGLNVLISTAVEVMAWMSNNIPHELMITCPCSIFRYFMLSIKAPDIHQFHFVYYPEVFATEYACDYFVICSLWLYSQFSVDSLFHLSILSGVASRVLRYSHMFALLVI